MNMLYSNEILQKTPKVFNWGVMMENTTEIWPTITSNRELN